MRMRITDGCEDHGEDDVEDHRLTTCRPTSAMMRKGDGGSRHGEHRERGDEEEVHEKEREEERRRGGERMRIRTDSPCGPLTTGRGRKPRREEGEEKEGSRARWDDRRRRLSETDVASGRDDNPGDPCPERL